MRLFKGFWLISSVLLTISGAAFAQTTSTFNGRVLDQGDAVLPGVTVTATNTSTGVVRTTVTNDEGAYSMPGSSPASTTSRPTCPGSPRRSGSASR